MQLQPVDLTELVAIVMGVSIILVPILGLTARFALKPTVEALSKFFEAKGTEETVQLLERRLSLVEQQLESTETTVERLREASEFRAELEAGSPEEG